ncbi:RHS repeat-associated core domain-containing protein [Paenibacillus sp. UMB7766-LJ446]|uniref:RHS repeat domain-containing protein n=1 Tax=Paenibacillus sp. UMB7766-LJ446 TaxID=3046313 RepID=UPI00254C646D|nr:RHS repeat-associated core domain-containing protein [Paenibacillus sp. UMB7766-LJ446]MDK8193132.1 RHS repeat-associated core domain-containing protein [Paenibacillus sp. UMB7766-LJ446]
MKKNLSVRKVISAILVLTMLFSLLAAYEVPFGSSRVTAAQDVNLTEDDFTESSIPLEDLISISSVAELFGVESDWIVSEMSKGYDLSDIYQGLNVQQSGGDYEEYLKNKYPNREITAYEIHQEELAQLENQLTAEEKEDFRQQSTASSSIMATQSGAYDKIAIQRAKLKYDQAPYSIGDATGGISMTDSSLNIRVTDLVLPGPNGMDFALTRVYNSAAGKDDIYFAEGEGGLYGNHTRISIDDERFQLGKGWSWDISYYSTNENRLHIAGMGSFMRSEHSGSGLEGMPYPYIVFAETSPPVGGNSDIRYVLENFQEDTRQYFDGMGNLVEIRDASGNRIVLTYSYMGRYAWPVLQTVMTVSADDKNRNYLTLEYQENTKTIRASVGNRAVTYKKTQLPYTTNSVKRDVLSEVIDPLGRSTKYTYTQYSQLPFNLFESYKDFTGTMRLLYWGWQDWVFLSAIEHPNKAITQYSTGMYSIHTGEYAVETAVTYSAINNSYSSSSATETRKTTSFVETTYFDKNAHGQDVTFSTYTTEGPFESKYTFKRKYWGDNTPDTFYLQKKTLKPIEGSVAEKVSTYTYDESKRIPEPTTIDEYSFGESGLLIRSQKKQTLDSFGLVSSITDATGATTMITNDVVSSNNRIAPTQVVVPISSTESLITTYTYDVKKGYLLTASSKNKAGTLLEQTTYEYDANGNVKKVTLKGSGKDTVVEQTFDQASKGFFLTGQSVHTTHSTGEVQTRHVQAAYDPLNGLQQSFTDGNGNVTSYNYDALGRITAEVYPDASRMSVTYNDELNSVTITDPTGITRSLLYTPLGDLNSERYDRGSTTYRYDSYGRLMRKLDYNGGSLSYQYDPWSRISMEIFGIGANRYEYDDVNRIKSITDGAGIVIRESYDSLDRITTKEEVRPAGNVVINKTSYDYAGNVTSLTDANNQSTKYTYDALSRLETVTDPLGQMTKYTYDLQGNLTKKRYADGQEMVYEYDEIGRLLKQTDPLGQYEVFRYDGADQLISHIDRMGHEQTNTYNSRGFMTSQSSPDETVNYDYDTAGRRILMTDTTGTTSYSYDSSGDLSQITYPDGATLAFSYEERGLRTQQEFTLRNYQLKVEQNYLTPLPLVSGLNVKDSGDTVLGAYTYSYRSNQSLTQIKTNDGLEQSYVYTGLNLTGLSQSQNGTPFGNYAYSYDNNRSILSKTDNGDTSTFTYDELDRLKSSSLYTESYSYDVRGNRKEMASDRPFDPRLVDYNFDQKNRLTSVNTETGEVRYRYNGDGLLVERTGTNGSKTRYYYDDRMLLVAEGVIGTDGAVTITAGYVYDANGEIQARHVPGESGLQTYWKNGHGDITELRNASGDRLNRYAYDVWGNTLIEEEEVSNVLRYAGEYWDSETGLQYLRARWYDPSVGRFISEDTFEGDYTNPLSLNLYTYVENNPLKYVDFTGESKRPAKNSMEGLGHGSGSASAGRGSSSRNMGGGGRGGSSSGRGSTSSKPSTSNNGQTSKGTGSSLKNIKNLDDILTDPGKLKGVKPDELHKYLKENGFKPEPLSSGSQKGVTFENGGGFKVNWGGDRILQYHPGSRHHGNVPYYKISSGTTGTNRYDMQGNLIK